MKLSWTAVSLHAISVNALKSINTRVNELDKISRK